MSKIGSEKRVCEDDPCLLRIVLVTSGASDSNQKTHKALGIVFFEETTAFVKP